MHRGVMYQCFEWNSPSDGSLWRDVAASARKLHEQGFTSVWLPPAYKGHAGAMDVGYGVYDMFDLGEFDQKESVRTRYGTREEFIHAVASIRNAGMVAYADVVFNHRLGADAVEEVEVVEVDPANRLEVVSAPIKIKTWSHFNFPGRGGMYSTFEWHWQHFTAFSHQVDDEEVKQQKVYRVADKGFSGEVSGEMGNFDYLMGADVDTYHPDVRKDLLDWGNWLIKTTNIDGFRLDAVKHIPSSFVVDWLGELREKTGLELFAVGEYWSADLGELEGYIAETSGVCRLFDVPLHFRFHQASLEGDAFDLRTIFENTLVGLHPLQAVTFVDNHDSQPGQSLESHVKDWFKPLAYALILLRRDGYPCVFCGDYVGNTDPDHQLSSHKKLIDEFLLARAAFTHGEQHDYFDHANCIGWCWTGTDENPSPLAVVMSNGDAGTKRMKVGRPDVTMYDLTGHVQEPITTDSNGEAEFQCPAGKVSVWSGARAPKV